MGSSDSHGSGSAMQQPTKGFGKAAESSVGNISLNNTDNQMISNQVYDTSSRKKAYVVVIS